MRGVSGDRRDGRERRPDGSLGRVPGRREKRTRRRKRKTSKPTPRIETSTVEEPLHFRGALSTQQTAKSAPATAWAMEALRGGWAVRAAPREAIPPRAKTSKSRRTYRHVLVPLPVAAHDVVALLLEPLREVRRDEAARAGDADLQLLLGPVRLGAVNPAQFVAGGGHLKLVLRLATSR